MQKLILPLSIILSAVIVSGAIVYRVGLETLKKENVDSLVSVHGGQNAAGVKWGNIGKQLIDAGVIDADKFGSLYAGRGGLTGEDKNLLNGDGKELVLNINEKNAGLALNLLWAFGLANKNAILEEGPMSDPRYGGADRFASTGGWTLAKGDAMDHYNRHAFVLLTPEQQKLVEVASKNIYRPCCNNPAYLPDCNHGMAMLGLLELLAAQGASEEEMYKAALQANAYWFPDAYATIRTYLESKSILWDKVNAKEILGANFSSYTGFQRVVSETIPPEKKGGASCGV